jgi:hypothetical protein
MAIRAPMASCMKVPWAFIFCTESRSTVFYVQIHHVINRGGILGINLNADREYSSIQVYSENSGE